MRTPHHDRFDSGHLTQHEDVFGPELTDLPVQQPPQQSNVKSDQELKTGTTTVGLQTNNGVILAADMRASMGGMVSSKSAQKIHELHPTAATTISGGVSAAQSLVKNVQAEVRLYEARRGKEMSIEALANLVANFLRSGAFFITVPLIGGVDNEGSHIISYDPVGGITEEEYAVSGSGSQYALGVLEQQYDEGLSLEDARNIAIRSVKSAVARDTASGNGMRVAEITEDGVDVSVYEDMEEVPSVE